MVDLSGTDAPTSVQADDPLVSCAVFSNLELWPRSYRSTMCGRFRLAHQGCEGHRRAGALLDETES